MKKSLLLIAALAVSGLAANAAREDDAVLNGSDYNAYYWNDVHEDGAYYPNWNIAFTCLPLDVYGPKAEFDYTLLKGTEVVSQDEHLSPSYYGQTADNGACNAYLACGVLPAGEYTISATAYFLDEEGVRNGKSILCPTVRFTVIDRSNLPKADLVYTVTNGNKTSVLDYEIQLTNIDEAAVASYRVWLDAPGNITMAEGDTKAGQLSVDVSGGNVTYWLKGLVTMNDGTSYTTVPNDLGITFEKIVSEDDLVITFEASNPQATSYTDGTLDYRFNISGKGQEEIDHYQVFVVTTGDRAVSDVIEVTDPEGVIVLKNLNEKAATELWAKGNVIMKDGSTYAELQFPGEAQGWTGLSIDTSTWASVATVGAALPASGDIYSVDGRLVRRGATGLEGLDKGLYILNGKLYQVR